jgi:hypothetical protein
VLGRSNDIGYCLHQACGIVSLVLQFHVHAAPALVRPAEHVSEHRNPLRAGQRYGAEFDGRKFGDGFGTRAQRDSRQRAIVHHDDLTVP